MQTSTIIQAIILILTLPFFAFIFIVIEAEYKKRNAKSQTKETKETMKTLDQLIAETKGKFFSVTFTKKDGSVRTVNGKDLYRRLLVGGQSTVRQAGYVPFVNRNASNILNKKGGAWISAHKNEVITFKCGSIKAEFVKL
jgi:hypothetical protein